MFLTLHIQPAQREVLMAERRGLERTFAEEREMASNAVSRMAQALAERDVSTAMLNTFDFICPLS